MILSTFSPDFNVAGHPGRVQSSTLQIFKPNRDKRRPCIFSFGGGFFFISQEI